MFAMMRQQIDQGTYRGGGSGPGKTASAVCSFSLEKYICMGFACEHWREYDKDGQPPAERAIIVLDPDCPDICLFDLLKHDLDPKLKANILKWLNSRVQERNAFTSPFGITGYKVIRSNGKRADGIEPGDPHFIPDVNYGLTGPIASSVCIMTEEMYDDLTPQQCDDMAELQEQGGGCLRVVSAGKFSAAAMLRDPELDHTRACHLLVGSTKGLRKVQQSLFLGKYNEDCAIEIKEQESSSPQDQRRIYDCTVGRMREFKKALDQEAKEVRPPRSPPPPPPPRLLTLPGTC